MDTECTKKRKNTGGGVKGFMRKDLLIVDDVELNRELLKELFRGQYELLEAENGEEAEQCLAQNRESVSAILLDIIMPVKDGFDVLNFMRENDMMKEIPVILITGDSSAEVQKKGYDMGVSDIISKPFDPYIVRSRVNNIVDLYRYKNHLEDLVEDQTKKLREHNTQLINTLGTIVEFRNMESGAHTLRIREFTRALLMVVKRRYPEYGLADKEIDTIADAAVLHDVGKISISDTVLLKPGKLTKEEFEIMKTHTTQGAEIVKQINSMEPDYFRHSYDIALHHHEKWDGHGYPDGLKGEEIPISAQVVSIADCYDALVSERVYKPPFTKEQAFQMILNGECGQFNPKLLECFKEVKPEFERLADMLH